MRKLSNIIAAILLCVLAQCYTPCANAQNVDSDWQYAMPTAIYEAMSVGNVAKLSSYLNSTVEISMPQGTSRVYSRKQAEVILKDYFSSVRNPQFEIEHERSMTPSTLTIGYLKGDGIYHRVFILTQKHGDDTLIHQLRVEEINL